MNLELMMTLFLLFIVVWIVVFFITASVSIYRVRKEQGECWLSNDEKFDQFYQDLEKTLEAKRRLKEYEEAVLKVMAWLDAVPIDSGDLEGFRSALVRAIQAIDELVATDIVDASRDAELREWLQLLLNTDPPPDGGPGGSKRRRSPFSYKNFLRQDVACICGVFVLCRAPLFI